MLIPLFLSDATYILRNVSESNPTASQLQRGTARKMFPRSLSFSLSCALFSHFSFRFTSSFSLLFHFPRFLRSLYFTLTAFSSSRSLVMLFSFFSLFRSFSASVFFVLVGHSNLDHNRTPRRGETKRKRTRQKNTSSHNKCKKGLAPFFSLSRFNPRRRCHANRTGKQRRTTRTT